MLLMVSTLVRGRPWASVTSEKYRAVVAVSPLRRRRRTLRCASEAGLPAQAASSRRGHRVEYPPQRWHHVVP